MRYLGNKKLLLPHIDDAAAHLGFTDGVVCDLFAGTGVVGRHFRSRGNRVVSTDLMHCSLVFQKVFLECAEAPRFAALRRSVDLPEPASGERVVDGCVYDADELDATLRVIRHLEEVVPVREGLLTRQYSPDGTASRMYFRPEAARRLDAVLLELRKWREAELVTASELHLLLAATIDAADRVANISGTYGAFLKRWQSNTSAPVTLRVPRLVRGPLGEANREDALEWIAGVEADLLYIDPPYNHRQYPANYHLLEVIARIPREPELGELEESIYGKTGLIPWKEQASPLCAQSGKQCRDAFRELLRRTRIPRVIISYNEEGIISRDEFEEMLAEYAGVPRQNLDRDGILSAISYPRFRSDADGRVARTGAGRRYRRLPGRERDEVHEWLFHVTKV